MTDGTDQPAEVRQLAPAQRRVLGTLLEKGKTTPEYYPMTLKGLTAACNQKNNRHPLVEYSEDHVESTLDSLQKLGLTAVIYPESGRALRYRHYFRTRYAFPERQVAILTELLLRGRQTLGELRTRASRLEPIEDLDTLREDVKALVERGFMQVNGPLEMRGVEVDHTFYLPSENQALPKYSGPMESETGSRAASTPVAEAVPNAEITRLSEAHDALREEVVALRATVEILKDRLDKLASDLGVS